MEKTRGIRQTRLIKNIVVTVLLVAGGLLMATPFLWLVSSSLKAPAKIWLYPPQLIPNPVRWQNYPEALTVMPFHLFFANTLTIVVFDEIGILFTASLAAYSFARLRFRGRDVVFFMLLSTMMLPWAVTMIPRYIMFRQLGWINTFLPLIVPNYFGGGAFNIFLLRQFFRTIPYEISDAGRIDGCSEFAIYWRLVLPLARPALATVAIFTFLNAWNDFMGPLIYLTSPNKRTLSLGLAAFRDLYTTQWHYLMAASTVVIVPVIILFFAAQRYFVQGIAFTGLKG
jgi:ABC-type glycerol-3-phosphate transport system permease component